MASRLQGTSVILYQDVETGTDPFGAPIIEAVPVQVDNILIGEPSTDDITSSTQLYGKTIQYMLGIPKGDTHDWLDKNVEWIDAYGNKHKVKTFGFPITGIEANIPAQLPWHMKVRVEAYG